MPSVLDVAEYIIKKRGAMTTMKLQKLVYYSQAWSTVWDDDVLFPEKIEAWKNGPVVRELWEKTKGQFKISSIKGADTANIGSAQCATIDRVLDFYGDKDAQWLSDLTHLEEPWKEAYERGQNTEITPEKMSEYYASLGPNDIRN